MRPVLFYIRWPGRLQPIPIPSYIALVTLGAVFAVTGAAIELTAHGWAGAVITATLALAVVAGQLAGGLLQRLVARFVLGGPGGAWTTGGSVVGGLIVGPLTLVGAAWGLGHPVLITLSIIAPYVFFGVAIGRVGCLLAGCDYGRRTRHGVRYPNWAARYRGLMRTGSPAFCDHVQRGWVRDVDPTSAPVHPVPIYWSIALAAGGVGLLSAPLILANGLPRGLAAVWLYTALTWALEPLRGDDDRGLFWGTSVAQWVSLALSLILGALWLSF